MQGKETESACFWFITAMVLVVVLGLVIYAAWGSEDEAQAFRDWQARAVRGGR